MEPRQRPRQSDSVSVVITTMKWFVWSGDAERRPLVLVRYVVGQRPVGLFAVIDESPATRSFAAHPLRSVGLAPALAPQLPAATFGAVEPDAAVPGIGRASLACEPITYEQIGLYIARAELEQLRRSIETRLEK